jgi:hypothetical protein
MEARVDRCLAVKYEELVVAPEVQVREILDFLGLQRNDTLVRDAFRKNHPGEQDPKAMVAVGVEDRSGKGAEIPLEFLSAEQLQRMGSLLKRLGYALPNEADEPGVSDAVKAPIAEPFLGSVEEVFEQHVVRCARANAAALSGKNSTIQFIVNGNSSGSHWLVSIVQGSVSVERRVAPAQSTVRLSAKVLLAIANREKDLGIACHDHREICRNGAPCLGTLKWLFLRPRTGRVPSVNSQEKDRA